MTTRREKQSLLALEGVLAPPLDARHGLSQHELAETAAALAERAPQLFAREAGRADARAQEKLARSGGGVAGVDAFEFDGGAADATSAAKRAGVAASAGKSRARGGGAAEAGMDGRFGFGGGVASGVERGGGGVGMDGRFGFGGEGASGAERDGGGMDMDGRFGFGGGVATGAERGGGGVADAPPAPGFLQLPWRSHALREITQTAERMRRGVRDVVQIGLGGSSLGAQVLMRALAHPLHNQLPAARRRAPRVHFLDNADPQTLGALLDVLDPRRTLLHVVSKSGGTLESAALFQALRPVLARALGRGGWQRRCVFTTGAGALREWGEAEGVALLDFPADVGGRYSALSASGLFTPALAGVDVAGVVSGARRWLRGAAGSGAQHVSARAAATAFLLATRHGKPMQVLMPYADALEPLARWYVQLCAESLGKVRTRDGRREHVGPTPLAARGSTDQHSQLQLFIEGPADKLVMFVTARRLQARGKAGAKLAGGALAKGLAGRTLAQVMHASHAATALALAEAGRPSLTWTLPAITPGALGALLLALELMTVGQALLYGVNPYDQPGVEFGKRAARKLLARS